MLHNTEELFQTLITCGAKLYMVNSFLHFGVAKIFVSSYHDSWEQHPMIVLSWLPAYSDT